MYKAKGSITVFLTLIFSLIFSLFAALYENAKVYVSKSYLRGLADNALEVTFGEYNLELKNEYGIFGYGGYAGNDAEEFKRKFKEKLEKNLERKNGYLDLFKYKDINVTMSNVFPLTKKELFNMQIKNCIIAKGIEKSTDALRGKDAACEKIPEMNISEELSDTKSLEKGNVDELKEKYGTDDDHQFEKPDVKMPDESSNPLETFKTLARDGVLSMVCDVSKLSKERVKDKDPEYGDIYNETGFGEEKDASEILSHILSDSEDAKIKKAGGFNNILTEKMYLLTYDKEFFSSFTNDKKKKIKYEVEYLITGKDDEKDNLLGVINRILVIRTAINYAYVLSDPILQEESLATATAITTALGVPYVAPAVAQTILLILSVEESLIDIVALLDGRQIPLFKDSMTFKIKYPEICMCNRAFFEKKAKAYQKSMGHIADMYTDYEEYLGIFMAATSEEKLRGRTCELIEKDLQEKYNETFNIDTVIGGVDYSIFYDSENIWRLPGIKLNNKIDGAYCYQ